MKLGIINWSGNVSKSTLRSNLFGPLLDAQTIHFKDVNHSHGEADIEIAASRFNSLAADLSCIDDSKRVVIDIGSTNMKAVMNGFSQIDSARESIDFWCIPVVAAKKQLIDSIKTARDLLAMDVDVNKIFFIITIVKDVETLDEDFKLLFEFSNESGIFVVPQVVLSNDVFAMLKESDQSVFSVLEEEFDPVAERKKAAAAGGDALRQFGERQVLRSLAKRAVANMKAVFEATPVYQAIQAEKAESVEA